MKNLLLYSVLFVFAFGAVKAQTQVPLVHSDWTNYDLSAINACNPCTQNVTLPPVDGDVNYRITDSKILVKIDFGDDYPFGDEAYQVDLNLNFNWFENATQQSLTSTSINSTITLNAASPEAMVYVDLPYNANPASATTTPYSNSYSFELDPTVTVTTSTANASQTALENAIRIQAGFESEYMVDVRDGNTYTTQLSTVAATQEGTSKQYKFHWNNDIATVNYPNYEIQLLKLENTELENPASKEELETNVIDWAKALSIVVPHHRVTDESNGEYSFIMTVPQGTGYYIWRVRPLGNYYARDIANNQNWGTWNNQVLSAPVSFMDASSTAITGNSEVFYYEDVDEDKNYIYGRVFSEDGNTQESTTYADGILRSRQSQTYLPSQNQTIVNQTIYDHQGRPAITTLPVPVDERPDGFKDKFVQNLNGDLYTVEDFDTDTKIDNGPDPMKLQGTDFDYYSNDNTNDEYVPSAQKNPVDITEGGFPFSRSEFSEDGLGYVREQSGVGPTHMMGEGNKTTKVKYEDVAEEELIRIFGEEAPHASVVSKQVTIDPNGIETYTYTNIKSGQVIATCMGVNDGNSSLEPLDSESDPETTFDVIYLLNNNQYIEGSFITTGRYYHDGVAGNDMIFTYTGNCNAPEICEVPVKTEFEVSFFLYDINDQTTNLITPADLQTIATNYSITLTPENRFLMSEICDLTNDQISFTISGLTKGEYTFKKVLTPTNAAIDDAITTAVNTFEEGIMPMTDLVVEMLAHVKENGDWGNFFTAMAAFDTYWHDGTNEIHDGSMLALTIKGVYPDITFDFNTLIDSKGIVERVFYNTTTNEIEMNYAYGGANPSDPCYQSGSFEFPVNSEPLFACQDPNNQFTFEGVTYDLPPFIEYFALRLEDYLIDTDPGTAGNQNITQSEIDNMFPGYGIAASDLLNYLNNGTNINDNNFNRMIWHMIFDVYPCGQMRVNNSLPAPSLEIYDEGIQGWRTLDVTLDVNHQYECDQLWKCWAGLIDTYQPLLDAYDNISLSNYAGMIDDQNDGDPDVHDDAVRENIPWILRIFLGKRKFLQNLRGTGPNPVVTANLANQNILIENLPYLFLSCSGFRFAVMIDPRVVSTPTQANAYSAYSTYLANNVTNSTGYNNTTFHVLDIPLGNSYQDGTGAAVTPPYWGSISSEAEDYIAQRATYPGIEPTDMPYIYNPVYAFKYFEYFDDNAGAIAQVPGNCKGCEMLHCYEAQNYETYCGGNDCTSGHDQWTCGKRYEFYACIKNSTLLLPELDGNEIVELDESNNPQPIDCETEEDSYTNPGTVTDGLNDPDAIGHPLVRGCYKACLDREDDIRAQVIALLEERCYVIGGCATETTSVSYAEIDLIVKQFVEDCAGKCEANASVEYINDCELYLADGTTTHISYCNIIEGSSCELFLMEQAKTWELELDIEPATQDCPSNAYLPAILGAGTSAENPASNCDGSDALNDQDYSPIETSTFNFPQGQ